MFTYLKKLWQSIFSRGTGTRVPVGGQRDAVFSQNLDDEPVSVLERRELGKRALNGWEAFKCCVKSRNDVSRFLTETVDGLQWAMENRETVLEAGVKLPSVVYKEIALFLIRMTPKNAPTGVFWTTLGWNPERGEFEEFDGFAFPIPGNNTELDRLRDFAQELAFRIRDSGDKVCKSCVREKLFGQWKPRRRGTGPFRKRSLFPVLKK